MATIASEKQKNGEHGNSATEKIEQLESEIKARKVEINRLKALEKNEANHDANDVQGKPKDPLDYSDLLLDIENQCLAMNARWGRKLTDDRKHPDPANARTNNSAKENTPPATICTSPQTDTSVTSNDADPPSPPARRFIESIRSPFSNNGKKPDAQNDLERMVKERDMKINELEAIILSNVELIYKMKDTIELITGGEAEHIPGKNVAELEAASPNRMGGEASVSSNKTNSSRTTTGSTRGELWSLVSAFQIMVKDMESTIQFQGKQNNSLREEVARLQKVINHMEAQEDEIETLRALNVKLELKSQMQAEEIITIQEELNTKLECHDRTISYLESTSEQKVEISQKMIDDKEDQIERLKCDIMKMKARSDMQEQAKRHEMEEMKAELEQTQLEMELSQLENSRH